MLEYFFGIVHLKSTPALGDFIEKDHVARESRDCCDSSNGSLVFVVEFFDMIKGIIGPMSR